MKTSCILVLLIIFSSCNGSNSAQSIEKQDKSSITNRLQKFAEDYTPRNTHNVGPDKVPKITDKIRAIIYTRDSSTILENEKYITLILLKLYRSHLECCNQSYELREINKLDSLDTPIIYAFLRYTNLYDLRKPIKFIPSSISYEWIKRKPILLDYEPIKNETVRIEELQNKIERGDF